MWRRYFVGLIACFSFSSLFNGSFAAFVGSSDGQATSGNSTRHGNNVCFQVDDVTNGRTKVDSIQYEVRCNKGYKIVGDYRFHCFSNGTCVYPNKVPPTCRKVTCERPVNLTNGTNSHILGANKTRFEFLENITIECDEWYQMQRGASTWMCDHKGNWVKTSRPIAPNPPYDVPVCRPKCGMRLVREDAFGTQIAGGKRVKRPGAWPWMAFVDFGGGRRGKEFCGGTLIDEKTVVTTASCMTPHLEDDVVVWLGILNRTGERFNFTQSFVVASGRRFIEPTFASRPGMPDGLDFDGDIGVLKLDRPASLSYYVHPICLPNRTEQENILRYYMLNRKKAVTIGWGQRPETRTMTDNLMRIKVGLVDRESCRRNYEAEYGHPAIVTENMVCTGKGTCEGDGGGPLMTEWGGKWYLSGINSFGDPICGRGQTHDVYTDVSKYTRFLERYMEK